MAGPLPLPETVAGTQPTKLESLLGLKTAIAMAGHGKGPRPRAVLAATRKATDTRPNAVHAP